MRKRIDKKQGKKYKEQQIYQQIVPTIKISNQQIQNDKSNNIQYNLQQFYAMMSPLPLPPKNYLNNPQIFTANQTIQQIQCTDLRIIQTPYANNHFNFKNLLIQGINEQLRQISARIDWGGTPARSNSPANQSDSQQQSMQHSDRIMQDQQDQSMKKQNHDLHIQQEIQQKSFHPGKINFNNQKKRLNKRSHQPKEIPLPNNQNKKVTCNCKKTKCLKLYCDCFRINQTCQGCNCQGCHNLQEYADQRSNAILVLMDRNPDPFCKKIQDDKHAKGCNCKKSNCLKKYCQCYQAGLPCGENCNCQQCKNCTESDKKPDQQENQCLSKQQIVN